MMTVLNRRRIAVNILIFLIVVLSYVVGYSICQRQLAKQLLLLPSSVEKAHADEKDLCQAKTLDYEQRLGKQSAEYARDTKNFGDAIKQFGVALAVMDKKNDQRAAARERAQAAALIAAQTAANAASATAKKTDQILIKQEAVQQQVTEAASAAKAAEKKIDTAVHPVIAVPPRPWSVPGGH